MSENFKVYSISFNDIRPETISAGESHSLGISYEGKVYSWGYNGNGQLGDGTDIQRNIPVEVDTSGVLDGKTIVQVSAGISYSLALDEDGKVYAWGNNFNGQLGNGNYNEYDYYDYYDYYGYTEFQGINSNIPVEVDTSGVLDGKNIVQVSAGSHSLALDEDGKVYAWGNNFDGQLGDGTNIKRFTPVEVDISGVLDGKTIVQVSAGISYSLALDEEGKVYSWGRNFDGQLGNGNFDEYDYYGYDDYGSNDYGSNDYGSDDYGYDDYGSTFQGINSNVPVEVDTSGVLGGKNIVEISAGEEHSLALDSYGKVYSWGRNIYGVLGDGTYIKRFTPVEVDTSGVLSGKTIVQVSANSYHSLVLDEDGKVYAWGSNDGGTLGDGTDIQRNIPVEVDTSGVLDGKNIVQISAGGYHSLALDSEGLGYAWGGGYLREEYGYSYYISAFGQLGIGSDLGSIVPVQIYMDDVESFDIGEKVARMFTLVKSTVFFVEEDITVSVVLNPEFDITLVKYAVGSQDSLYFESDGIDITNELEFSTSVSGIFTVFAKDIEDNIYIRTININNIVDKTELRNKIAEADIFLETADPEIYSVNSWNNLLDSLDYAKLIEDSNEFSQSIIDLAVFNLSLDNFIVPTIDRDIEGNKVTISVNIESDYNSYLVKDGIPEGLTPIEISDNGVWDEYTRKVKWIFEDSDSRELYYILSGDDGEYVLGPGSIVFGGEEFYTLKNNTFVLGEELEWLGHQVDIDRKWRIELSDILPYMAAYRQGESWYGEAIGRGGVALFYVLNAMAIYTNGEYYERLDDIEEPNCWVALSV